MSFGPDVETGTSKRGVRFHRGGAAKAPGARPLLLLHGTGGSAYSSFKSLLPMMSTSREVFALDFMDEFENHPSGLDEYAAQALDVIETIGAPVDLVGYSFGAVIAAAFAGLHPDKVSSLVLIAGWLRTDRQQLLRNDIWEGLHRESSSLLGPFMTFTAFSDRYLRARPSREIAAISEQLASDDRAFKMDFNRSVDITRLAEAIHAPTLVIGCSEDQMVPIHHSRLLFGAIDDARFAEIPSGHAVVTERPAELLSICDEFLRDPSQSAAGTVFEPTHA